jgi:hypothetical protein
MPRTMRRRLSRILLACVCHSAGCTSPAVADGPSGGLPTSRPATTRPAGAAAGAPDLWRDRPWPYEVVWAETGEPATVAVYVTAARGGTEEKGPMPWLLTAVWPDGRVVWSDDRVEGGRPYRCGHVAAGPVRALVARLDALAADGRVPSEFHHVGPDYPRQILQFRAPDGRVYGLGSWHELLEAGGGTVMTDRGNIKLRPGETPEQALREHATEPYRRMRRVWAALRRAVSDAVPTAGHAAPENVVRFVSVPVNK